MNVIIAPRQSGKTTRLLRLAAKRGGVIVTQSQREADRLRWYAKELGLKIKKPVTLYQARTGEVLRGYSGEVYIDDVDMILRNYLGGWLVMHTVTMTGVGDEITERETAPPEPPVTKKRTVMIG